MITSQDPNCLSEAGGLCNRCSARYYLNTQGKCFPINPLCRTHNDFGECTSCYPGYILRVGKCQIGTEIDPNCK